MEAARCLGPSHATLVTMPAWVKMAYTMQLSVLSSGFCPDEHKLKTLLRAYCVLSPKKLMLLELDQEVQRMIIKTKTREWAGESYRHCHQEEHQQEPQNPHK